MELIVDKIFTKRRIWGIVFLITSVILAFYIELAEKSETEKKAAEIITIFFLYLSITHMYFEKNIRKNIILRLKEFIKRKLDNIIKYFEIRKTKKYRDPEFIKGYTDVSTRIQISPFIRKKKKKFKNYKNMNNREKIRFLFYKRVKKEVKRGYVFKDYMTPSENIKGMLNDKYLIKNSNEIIDIYNEARYNDKSEVIEDTVFQMENITRQR